MAILFLDGFDKITTTTGSTSPGPSDAEKYVWRRYAGRTYYDGVGWHVRDGWGYGHAISPGTGGDGDKNWLPMDFPARQDLYFGLAIRPRAANGLYSSTLYYLQNQSDGITHVQIGIANNGLVQFWRGSSTWAAATTDLGTYLFGVKSQNWSYLEFYVSIHDSTGAIKLRHNGVEVLNLTGLDTRNGGSTATMDNVVLLGMDGTTDSRDDVWLFDDIYVSTTGFLGPSKVETLVPTAEGDQIDFTPSTGTDNSATVDTVPADDTLYNSSPDTAGNEDLLAMSDLTNIASDVAAIQVNVAAAVDGSTPVGLRPKIKSSTSTATGNTREVFAANPPPERISHIFETDPSTSAAWTVSGVNGLQAGYEVN